MEKDKYCVSFMSSYSNQLDSKLNFKNESLRHFPTRGFKSDVFNEINLFTPFSVTF